MIDIGALQKLVNFNDEDKQLILNHRPAFDKELDHVRQRYSEWFLAETGWQNDGCSPILPGYIESIISGNYGNEFISQQYHQALYWYKNGLDATTSIAAISKLSSLLHETGAKIEPASLPQAVCKIVSISQAILSVVHHVASTYRLLQSSADSEISRIQDITKSFSDEMPRDLAHAYIEHLNWKLRAYSLALGTQIDIKELQLSPNECVLGKWLNSGGLTAINESVRAGFVSAHNRLHEIAKVILALAEAGEPENMVAYLLDMESASKEVTLILGEHIERELRKLVTIDGLTKIGNRRGFISEINHKIDESLRTKVGFGLLFLDVDHFKDVNDKYGHTVGDEVLKAVTRKITKALRTTDVAYRWGGEEFVILASSIQQQGVSKVAERVLSAMNETPITTSTGLIKITVSIGCVYYHPDSSWTIDELVARADHAMIEAKELGRNRVVCRCNSSA